MMQNTVRFLLGLLLGLTGVAGLILAAQAETPLAHYGGLGVFAVNYVMIMGLIRSAWPKRRYQ